MLQLAGGWSLDVERGPDWLFVRVAARDKESEGDAQLAEQLMQLLKQNFVTRLVLECDELGHLTSALVGQLVMLHKRIRADGGLMRLCNLSEANYQVLCTMGLDKWFPKYHSRQEAVWGYRPRQPR